MNMTDTLLTALTALGGLEMLKWLFTRRSQMRISNARASIEETSAEEARAKLYQQTVMFLQSQLSSKEERFAAQTELLRESSKREIELTRELGRLQLELLSSRCDIIGCTRRQPPLKMVQPAATQPDDNETKQKET